MATRSWNRVELIGNLTRDPELRYTPQGNAVATFSVATNRTFVSEGEKREEADFHRCVAWNKLAELCSQLLKKGNKVFLSGRLQNRSWEDSSGQSRQTTEIVIEDMILLTSKSNGGDFQAYEDVSPAQTYSKKPAQTAQPQPSDNPAPSDDAASPEPADDVSPEESKKAQKETVEDLDDLPF